MKLEITIETNNEDYLTNGMNSISMSLRDVITKLKHGATSFGIIDGNGNTIGQVMVTDNHLIKGLKDYDCPNQIKKEKIVL